MEKQHQVRRISVCGAEFSHQVDLALTAPLINDRVLGGGVSRDKSDQASITRTSDTALLFS